jgi:hypothetical protein
MLAEEPPIPTEHRSKRLARWGDPPGDEPKVTDLPDQGESAAETPAKPRRARRGQDTYGRDGPSVLAAY